MVQVLKVDHFFISVPNQVGEGARILGKLRSAGVNLLAVWGYPAGEAKAQFEMVAENGAAFTETAKKLGLDISGKQTAFFINGYDRPGAIADVLADLAKSNINVGALQAVSAGSGAYGAVIYLAQKDVDQAAKIFGL